MNLLAFATSRGGTGKPGCPAFAKLAVNAKCSADTIYLIARGHKRAGPKLARKLEVASDGFVSMQELRPDVFGPAEGVANG